MSETLFDTVAIGNYDDTEALLIEGEDPNQVDEQGETPLIYAVYNSNLAMAELLLKYGADPNLGATFPLIVAVTNEEIAITKVLLAAGANPNIQVDQTAPIHTASLRSFPEIVRMLLEAGAFTNIQDGRGNTPLHYAVYRANYVISKQLVEGGADTMIKDLVGKTPIDYAKFFELEKILQLFIPNKPEKVFPYL